MHILLAISIVDADHTAAMSEIQGMSDDSTNTIAMEAGTLVADQSATDVQADSANYGFNAMEDSKEHRLNIGASYTF